MRFSVATILAFAATAFAQTADFDPIYAPTPNEKITAGSTFTITWKAPAKYSEGTVKIELIGGATQNTQVPLADIASGVKNSAESYSWKVDASLGDKAVYGLVIRYESDPTIFQYSNPFHITASGNQPSGTSSSSVTKTVTLSSLSSSTAPVTSTAAASSTSVTTTSAPATTSTHSKTIKSNTTLPANTTLVVKTSSSQSAPVLITSTAVFKPTTAAPTTTAPSTLATPTAAANVVRVGSLAILGVVAAVLAL
ncbi:Ser-Thr-rich, GPI-anchored family protein [Metarhizium robertsii]|uniref:Cell wall beta-glucan synthesis n=2 Tax=Metarhizium robertsii TaxID=568076 RepID=E9EW85_METRA|nr:Cell wall beta-glucan synthesis [Metarhizium robertsii ARSEF 23]EFZ00507.1 Cell wall beta-glucan synthesis [Metarhizium robertsii ARSEF 23]EXV02995.1 Ser-Thr-rich, GPI-anchored family protein [Metarhizium robertsii]